MAKTLTGMMIFRATALIGAFLVAVANADADSAFKPIAGSKLMHLPSGFVYPKRVGQFDRIGIQYYDASGLDVSARYIIGNYVLLDAYIYPSMGRSLKQESAHQQSDIRRLSKNVRLLSESRVRSIQGGRSLEGNRAAYDLVRTDGLLRMRGAVRCGSQFTILQDEHWFVACRVSYPIERSPTASMQFNQFLDQWKWRER